MVSSIRFGAAVVSVTATSFVMSDFDTLVGSLSTPNRSTTLDSGYFCKVKPTWLPPGFSNVRECNRWSAAGSKVNGLVCDSDRVIGLRTAVLMLWKEDFTRKVLERRMTELTQIGLAIEL